MQGYYEAVLALAYPSSMSLSVAAASFLRKSSSCLSRSFISASLSWLTLNRRAPFFATYLLCNPGPATLVNRFERLP